MNQRRQWLILRHWFMTLLLGAMLGGWTTAAMADGPMLRYFPVGPIYEYRWKLLELALEHTKAGQTPLRLQPYTEDVTQNRSVSLLQSGAIDVLALGTDADRETKMLPVRIDILKGIVGYRVFLIRAGDQPRIASMDDATLRRQLIFGLNSQWADLPIMRANGLSVETASGYDNLFSMLAAGRFDAFPRGINEASRELAEFHDRYPQLALEQSKALYFPYPVYFWVRKDDVALAHRIAIGLQRALADGSFRRLFESYHAAEIGAMRHNRRHVLYLPNPLLPAGNAEPDTRWWWR